LLTAICGFTKYLVCVHIQDKVSKTVADVRMRYLYLNRGLPEIVVHDQGGEFWSDVTTRLAELLDIQPSKIISHRPNLNRVVESACHSTLYVRQVSDPEPTRLVRVGAVCNICLQHYGSRCHRFFAILFGSFAVGRVPIELLLGMPPEAAYETEDM